MHRSTNRFGVLCFAIAASLFFQKCIFAQDFWAGPIGGNFDEGFNWLDGSAPGAGESALFALDSTYVVQWDSVTGSTENGFLSVTDGNVTLNASGGPFTHSLIEVLRVDNSVLSIGSDRPASNVFNLRAGHNVVVLNGATLNVVFGSQLELSNPSRDFYVGGGAGTSTMNVTNGGTVLGANNQVYLGQMAGTNGTLNVDGSTMSDTSMIVGDHGTGTLNIRNASVVTGNVGRIGGSSGTGTVVVRDTGSIWDTAGNINIGLAGNGILTIQNDGFVRTRGNAFIGQAGGTGFAYVTGSGSTWEFAGMFIGGDGNGNFEVQSGGTATSTNDRLISVGAGGNINVNAPGSTLSGASIIIGSTGGGSMLISQGGVVTTERGGIAGTPGTNGTVTVINAGSEWNNPTGLAVGGFGNATMNVIDNARVSGGFIDVFEGSVLTMQNAFLETARRTRNLGTMLLDGSNEIRGDLWMDESTNPIVQITGDTRLTGDLFYEGGEIRTTGGSTLTIEGRASGNTSFRDVGTLMLQSSYSPGDDLVGVRNASTISFEGDLVLGAGAILNLDLAGNNAGEFDKLVINGSLMIDGELRLNQLFDYVPEVGSTFQIIDVGGPVFGEFDGLGEGSLVGSIGGRLMYITYMAGSGDDVALIVVSAVPEPESAIIIVVGMSCTLLRRRRSPALT